MTMKISVREPWNAVHTAQPAAGASGEPASGPQLQRAAGRDEEGLSRLVEELVSLFPGAGLSLLEMDPAGRGYAAWHTGSVGDCDAVEAAILGHLRLMADRRVRLIRMDQPAAASPASYNCALVIRFQSRIDGLTYVLAVSLKREGGRILPEDERLLADRAGCLVERLEEIKADVSYGLRNAFGNTVTANAPWGILAIGPTGKLCYASTRARRMLSGQCGLHIRHGRLQFDRAAVARTFEQILCSLSAWDGADEAVAPPSRALSIPGPGGRICYALWLTPVAFGLHRRPGEASVIGYLSDLLERVAAERPLLATIFSLTAKEAHLAELFGSGHNLEQAAAMMGISRNTARIHLSNIFSKTATSNQVQLARLLARLPSAGGSRVHDLPAELPAPPTGAPLRGGHGPGGAAIRMRESTLG